MSAVKCCETVSDLVCTYSDGEGEEGESEGGEEEGTGEGEGEEGRVLSLAEQFEQIKKCRYIRHYRPDGTAVEEYYEIYQ